VDRVPPLSPPPSGRCDNVFLMVNFCRGVIWVSSYHNMRQLLSMLDAREK
jgi:hypothetical protein